MQATEDVFGGEYRDRALKLIYNNCKVSSLSISLHVKSPFTTVKFKERFRFQSLNRWSKREKRTAICT
jgi:hypothetical protein